MDNQNNLIYPTVSLSDKQATAWQYLTDKITRFLLFGGGAGGSKSWLGCVWLLVMCYTYPGTKWFIGRKELKRLMGSTYVTFMKVTAFYKVPSDAWKLNGQYNYIQFKNGSRIDLLDLAPQPSDPLYERFGSFEYTGGWIEEAGEVEFMCFDVLKSRIGRQRNDEYGLNPPKLLLTCNPTQNWLYRLFYKPFKDKVLEPGYMFLQSLYRDNPFAASQYAEQLGQLKDPVLRARLRDGLWEYSEDSLKLMKYDNIVDLFSNTVPYSDERCLIVDAARFGADKIVMGVFQGFNLIDIEEKSKQSTVTTEDDIRDLANKWKIPFKNIVVDEDGLGGGIVDHLTGVRGFMGGRTALIDPKTKVKGNYKNLRSQCYFLFAEKVNMHEVSITAEITEVQKEIIIEDLQVIKRVDTEADAPLQVVPKEELKDSIGRSPDYADMLMMRMYLTLQEATPGFNIPSVDKIMERGGFSQWGGVPGY